MQNNSEILKSKTMNLKTILLAAGVLYAGCVQAENLELRYDSPARFFEEGLVIGNGKIGATIYGGIECDSLSLNDICLWTGGPDTIVMPDGRADLARVRKLLDEGKYKEAETANKKLQGHFTESYQPLGRLYIKRNSTSDKSNDYIRRLDISDAVAYTGFTADGKHEELSYFASSPDSVIVIRLDNNHALDLSLDYSSQLPAEIKASGNSIIIDGYAAYHSYPSYYGGVDKKHEYDASRGTRFRTIVKVLAPDSKITADGTTLSVKGGKNAVILVSNETSFNGYDKNPVTEGKDYKSIVARNIDKASKKAYNDLLSRHKADYKTFFDRVKIDLGTTAPEIKSLPTDIQLRNYTDSMQVNPELEALYFQFGRYLLISCSRTPGVPANLQGLWNERILPPWSCNYTSNINLEENYWPSEVLNLGEMHLPLMEFVSYLSKNGRSTAQNLYGVNRGWSLGHNTDIWAMTCPVGLLTGDTSWANWNMGGAWVATHLWEHYMFSQDKAFLAEYYPILKGAAEFCLDWLVERDGKLMTSPGTSPENKFLLEDGTALSTSAGTTSDLAMIKECLIDAVKAARELGTDEEFVAEANSAIERLQPYQIGSNGGFQEWLIDWKEQDPHHRHQSHLYGLYPGHHISVEATPELAKACHQTLILRGPESTGWSTGWRVNLYARLLDSDMAYATYRKLLKYVSPDAYKGKDARRGGGTYPNLLDAHSPFQIDGNFGGAAGVGEMLLQSDEKTITLLPACPSAWSDGSISGLCARGGFELDFAWNDGKVNRVDISSKTGGATSLKVNGKTYDVNLKAGEKKTLTI